MKIHKILMCLCALVVFSCETEDASNLEQELTNVNLTARAGDPPLGWEDWNSTHFELYLRSISEQIAYTLSEDPLAAAEFDIIVHNNTIFNRNGGDDVVVPLDDIFSDSNTYLYQALETILFPCIDRPDGSYGQPYPPVGGHAMTSYEIFVGNMLKDHCLELYLPFGFNPASISSGNPTETIGISHPLTDTGDSNSLSYWARQFPSHSSDECADYINLDERDTYTNLMIIRPNPSFAVTPDNYCSYAIYSDIDFTDFFKQ